MSLSVLHCAVLFHAVIAGAIFAVEPPAVGQLPGEAHLPDPFLRADGTRVRTAEEWRAHRSWLLEVIQRDGYGTVPPAGGAVSAVDGTLSVPVGITGSERTIALTCGPGGAITVDVVLTVPAGSGPFPVIVVGDLCWKRLAPAIVQAVIARGYALAEFDRTRIAKDEKEALLPLAALFPGNDAGAVAAWAWGFGRVTDHLLTRPEIDRARVIATGHSRGGKAVLLAGIIDERIALVAPNNSGCMGAGCSRFAFDGESVERITRVFPHWFAARLRNFAEQPARLPFDQHTLKALVAPRPLLSTEGLGDHWANPRGTQITFQAAREVYRFLGVETKLGVAYRPGQHEHGLTDFTALLDFADLHLGGKAITRDFAVLPFDTATTAYFTWSAPTPAK